MKVWIDGRIVDGSEARVPVADHGFLYGDGVFEGLRVYARRVFRLEQHLARLAVSARAVGLEDEAPDLPPYVYMYVDPEHLFFYDLNGELLQ
jgi:branched-subunit amino acid aminotransferase/4-amino-4-deoxychorismate lyase